ncbi:MAG: arginyltransferase [Pseudomonadales bacterium]|nr:arginyltransferase [Pseudomonadales bacterium]NRA18609.1 arginyltransferase [Oceanospirillaceae bacterium]
MIQLTELQFFATPEHDCSYLSGLKAKTLFIDPNDKIEQRVYTQLSELGFRRSGKHIYRPHCDNCQACMSIRLPVQLFDISKSQRRVLNKNRDLIISKAIPQYTDEYYDLYQEYIQVRHVDGDMYPPSKDQFINFLVESTQQSCFYEFRQPDGKLVAVANMDILEGSLSAVYTFFDPKLTKRSLGSFAILWQIAQARRLKLDYLYLGYWVENCQKMKYKTDYKPMQLLINGKWLLAQ